MPYRYRSRRAPFQVGTFVRVCGRRRAADVMIGALSNAGNGKGHWSEFPCTIHRFTGGTDSNFRTADASRKGPTANKRPNTVPKTALSTTPTTQMKNTQLTLVPMVSNQCKLSLRMTCPKVSVGLYGP